MNNITVVKRDGEREPLDLEKIHQVLSWACNDIKGVSISEIELKCQFQFFDGIKSKEIHETLIKTCADLISVETPNYQYVATKLVNFNLRKEVYGQYDPWTLIKLVEHNVALGKYEADLLNWYSAEEFSRMNKFIRHDRDYNILYAGMGQMLGKYLVQNRVKNEYFETPQMAYILIAATLFHKYPKEIRMKYVKDYYDALSMFDITIPTPILAGARTPTKQFSSCVLIDSNDSLDSINATSSAIVNYVSKKAGIGINAGRIRAIGSEIRGGEIAHTGLVPFMKYFQSALKSCLTPDTYVEVIDNSTHNND
jgi:ribonucleoside-diphosphate reductase alpha chain